LGRLIPRNVANEIIFAGRKLTGEEALQFGLINDLVEAGAGLARAREIANDVAANPTAAVVAAMQILRAVNDGVINPLWDLGMIIASTLRKSDEARQLAGGFVDGERR
jgi:enoyl-CoA hydratase/carnithine racemase